MCDLHFGQTLRVLRCQKCLNEQMDVDAAEEFAVDVVQAL